MREVEVAVTAPVEVDAMDYRDRVQARAAELGWPAPHSAGIFLVGQPVADLQWTVPDDAVADVVAVLRAEFDVRSVAVFDNEDMS